MVGYNANTAGGGGNAGDPNLANNISSGSAYTDITINATGTVVGTNAPYIQLLACQNRSDILIPRFTIVSLLSLHVADPTS